MEMFLICIFYLQDVKGLLKISFTINGNMANDIEGLVS